MTSSIAIKYNSAGVPKFCLDCMYYQVERSRENIYTCNRFGVYVTEAILECEYPAMPEIVDQCIHPGPRASV